MAISRSDMERQLRKDGGILTLEDAKRMAPPGESLAYINPDEAALLKSLGGAGEDINGTGIKSYFIKKIVRKAKKAVKKVVKSPVGKAAILGALTFGIPGTQFGGFMGKGALGGLKAKLFGGALPPSMGFSSPGILGKLGLTKGGGSLGLTGLGKLATIGGLSGLAGLMAAGEQDEEDEIDFSKLDRGEGLNILDIVARARKNDPEFRFLPGAEFTGSYAEGGEVDKKMIMIKNMLDRGADDSLIQSITGATQEEINSVKTAQAEGKAEGGGVKDRSTIKEIFDDDTPKTQDIVDLSEGFTLSPITILRRILAEKELEEKRKKKAEGGIMNLGGNEMDLRGGGFVPIGAKEKADDVPARLSKNEFVMTADAVRAAGGGSVDKGADRMYNMMKNLEAQV